MRSYKIVRSAIAAFLVATVSVGTFTVISAQEATPETDPMMSEMMMMEGACPEGAAATMLEEMDMSATGNAGMEMTEEPEMMATEEMGMEEEEPAMEATDEAMMGVSCLFGTFSGLAEVPGPGDDDGVGFAFVSVDSNTGNICYDVAVANITLPAQAMHIHVGAAGVGGDVVVPFPTAPDEEGLASGCTTADVEGLAAEIAMNPEGYYVNVHTEDFPAGAVRAQLSSWNSEMMGMGEASG